MVPFTVSKDLFEKAVKNRAILEKVLVKKMLFQKLDNCLIFIYIFYEV